MTPFFALLNLTIEREYIMIRDQEPIVVTIADLKPRMRNLTVSFKVMSKTETREVTSRDSGEAHKISDAVIGDNTGTIIMPLWDDMIQSLVEGNTYRLENGYTSLFQGHLRLNIGRYGKISPSETPVSDVKTDIDMSAQEHQQFRRRPRRRNFRGNKRAYNVPGIRQERHNKTRNNQREFRQKRNRTKTSEGEQ